MAQTGFTPVQLYHSTTAAETPSAGNLAAGELAVNITDGKLFYKDNGGVVRVLATAAGSAGDVVGPGSSTDNALVRFDGTTGKLVQSSVGVLSDAGALSGLTSVAATTFTGALTGNASTATTLQTSRTIWGQSFDGSANVTGALTGVTDLTASGSLTLNGGVANGVAYLNGSKVLTSGSALTFDGSSLRLANAVGTTANGLRLDGGAQSHYWYLSDNVTSAYEIGSGAGQWKWLNSNGEQMRLTSTGLGIGTSSPGAKLHVKVGTNQNIFFDSSSGVTRITAVNDAVNDNVDLLIQGETLRFNTDGTERMRLDSSGNLGLGVTPSAWSAYKVMQISGVSGVYANGSNEMGMFQNAYYNGGWKYGATGVAAAWSYQYQGQHVWQTAPSGTAGNAISFTQAMTLDASGNLLVGKTADVLGNTGCLLDARGSVTFTRSGAAVGYINRLASDGEALIFMRSTVDVGSIDVTTTTTSYNTSSDYRLKENIAPMTGALAKIAALKPVTYTWKADGSEGEGFIAHELAEVCPAAVTGEKDAVDAEGKPQYQGIDVSFLVGTLTAAIQELKAEFDAYKATHP